MRFFTFLLLFVYANLSFALGLGEIELKSSLGEPLLAQIIVTDVEKLPDVACFSISDIGDTLAFRKAAVSLKQVNGNSLLTISTKDAITEPIVNLRVSVQCDPQINRDYLLLLDPVTSVATENTPISQNVAEKQISSDKPENSHRQSKARVTKTANSLNQADADTPPAQPVKKKKLKKPDSTSTSTNQKLAEAYTGKQLPPVAASSKPSAESKPVDSASQQHRSTDKPFLVISGGNTDPNNKTAKPSLSLRLETQIDLARTEVPMAALSATDTMDEVTVMSNRLAHLEKQIVSLQSRNTQLLADVEKAKNAGPNWSQILFIGFIILAILASGEWLRRKILNSRNNKDATWFDAGLETDSFDELETFDKDTSNNSDAPTIARSFSAEKSYIDDDFNDISNQNSNSANMPAFTEHEKDDSESVIDHADVFIEHGRPALAIQLLQNHLSDLPAESPAVWLKLLNLLAREGNEADYDEAVIESNQYFNIKATSFADSGLEDLSSIEDYPDIVTRLEGIWSSQYTVGFLNDLIYHQQSQPKEGFQNGTFNDLFFLKKIAEVLESSNDLNQQSSFYQPDVIKPNLEKVAFNQAAFSTEESLKTATDDDLRNGQNQQPANFESTSKTAPSYGNLDSSYEVNMVFDTEDVSALSNPLESLDLTESLKVAPVSLEKSLNQIDEIFQADEINFLTPDSDVYLNEASSELTLDTDFLIDEMKDIEPELNLTADKPKTKASKKAASNIIEWDLPKLDKE
ncbi:MAG: hypothetical protein H7Z70_02570 [Bacteroidia bacterium]|nr:hypothetical protein [Methylotenera sp.]